MGVIPWCVSQGSPGDVVKDTRVQCWIENYRNLLDAWRFWHKRAEFDIHRSKLDPSSKPLAQAGGFITSDPHDQWPATSRFTLVYTHYFFFILIIDKPSFIYIA